jgi:hypothetical protein
MTSAKERSAKEREHVPLVPVTAPASEPDDAEPSSSSPGQVPGAFTAETG